MSALKTITIVISHEERQAREAPREEWPTIGAIFKDVAILTDYDSVYVATLCIPADQEEAVSRLAEEKGYVVKEDMMADFKQPSKSNGAGNNPSGPA